MTRFWAASRAPDAQLHQNHRHLAELHSSSGIKRFQHSFGERSPLVSSRADKASRGFQARAHCKHQPNPPPARPTLVGQVNQVTTCSLSCKSSTVDFLSIPCLSSRNTTEHDGQDKLASTDLMGVLLAKPRLVIAAIVRGPHVDLGCRMTC